MRNAREPTRPSVARQGLSAVILAAGRSSRMGACKALLPLGSATVVARVVDSIRRAGIEDVVVVTGHNSEEVGMALDALPVRSVCNAGYDAGMFSSIRAGAGALRDELRGFVILPVDYPLVGAGVVESLIEHFRESGPGILHPACCGLRGHPPLLAGRYRAMILQADDRDTLRDLLDKHRDDAGEVEVDDLTILMDMDTTEDYRRTARFASILDAPKTPGRSDTQHGGLSPEDALHLLALLKVPDQVVRHSRVVASVGEALAAALAPHTPSLDIELVRAACLVHDLARTRPRHAAVGERLLANLGLARLAAVVGAHMVLPAEQLELSRVTEEQVVYLADKLVIGDRVCGLDEKSAHALHGRENDIAAAQGARTRMLAAQIISRRVESLVGRPLREVLPRDIPTST